jgi:uncharacterized protein (DUF779 family)
MWPLILTVKDSLRLIAVFHSLPAGGCCEGFRPMRRPTYTGGGGVVPLVGMVSGMLSSISWD